MPIKFICLVGGDENVRYSIRDAFLRFSDIIKGKPPHSLIWGFHSGYRNEYELKVKVGDEIFLYATRPTKAWLLYGVIIDKFEDPTPYWPKDSPRKDKWPLRILIRVLKVPKSILDNPDDMSKWDSTEFIPYSEIRINVRKSLVFLKQVEANRLKELMDDKGWVEVSKPNDLSSITSKEYFNLPELAVLHLISGKNLILVGPPGTGKTRLSKELCKNMGVSFDLITADAEMTSFDLIGGDVPSEHGKLKYRTGYLTDTIVKCWNRILNNKPPHWLIVDEINRANVDLAFGKAFTLMDIEHRRDMGLIQLDKLLDKDGYSSKEFLEQASIDHEGSKELRIPYSFRIIATMNSYDRAILIKLGYALLRRFAIIHVNSPFTPEKPRAEGKIDEEFLSKYSDEDIRNRCLEEALSLLLQYNDENVNDYGILEKQVYYDIKKLGEEGFTDIKKYLDFIVSISKYFTVEKIVQYGYAHIVDAFKFMLAGFLKYKVRSENMLMSLVDEAISAYILPQLDVIGSKIRSEEILGTGGELRKKINYISRVFNESGLTKSYVLIELLLSEGRIL